MGVVDVPQELKLGSAERNTAARGVGGVRTEGLVALRSRALRALVDLGVGISELDSNVLLDLVLETNGLDDEKQGLSVSVCGSFCARFSRL